MQNIGIGAGVNEWRVGQIGRDYEMVFLYDKYFI